MLELTDWLIPLLIFVARIFDVSIGTVRMIMVISGHRVASAAIGFVEVLIWMPAISRRRSSAVMWSGLRPLGMDHSETVVVSRVIYAL